jgi:hypothetical protein
MAIHFAQEFFFTMLSKSKDRPSEWDYGVCFENVNGLLFRLGEGEG